MNNYNIFIPGVMTEKFINSLKLKLQKSGFIIIGSLEYSKYGVFFLLNDGHFAIHKQKDKFYLELVSSNNAAFENFKLQMQDLPVNKKSKKGEIPVYAQAVDYYFKFFISKTEEQIKPKFDNIEGDNMKKVLKHLKNISGGKTWEEGLEIFKAILDNWDKLDKFYKDKYDIKLIFGQINNIIIGLSKRKEQIGNKSISDLDKSLSQYF